MEPRRVELLTSCVQSRRSPNWTTAPEIFSENFIPRNRQKRFRGSFSGLWTPRYARGEFHKVKFMGPSGIEPETPALSARCSSNWAMGPEIFEENFIPRNRQKKVPRELFYSRDILIYDFSLRSKSFFYLKNRKMINGYKNKSLWRNPYSCFC